MDANIPPRVQAALEGRFDAAQLTEVEAEIYYANEGEAMELYDTPEAVAWKAKMRKKGGVGINEVGQLVYQFPDSDQEVVLDFDPEGKDGVGI